MFFTLSSSDRGTLLVVNWKNFNKYNIRNDPGLVSYSGVAHFYDKNYLSISPISLSSPSRAPLLAQLFPI